MWFQCIFAYGSAGNSKDIAVISVIVGSLPGLIASSNHPIGDDWTQLAVVELLWFGILASFSILKGCRLNFCVSSAVIRTIRRFYAQCTARARCSWMHSEFSRINMHLVDISVCYCGVQQMFVPKPHKICDFYFAAESVESSQQNTNAEVSIMETIEKIKQQLAENPIILYMKGSPKLPSCGFLLKQCKH